MYSAKNEWKSVVVGRIVETWKSEIYKYMTSVSKNVYLDKLADIVNTHHT